MNTRIFKGPEFEKPSGRRPSSGTSHQLSWGPCCTALALVGLAREGPFIPSFPVLIV